MDRRVLARRCDFSNVLRLLSPAVFAKASIFDAYSTVKSKESAPDSEFHARSASGSRTELQPSPKRHSRNPNVILIAMNLKPDGISSQVIIT